jgi:hypothetical protein
MALRSNDLHDLVDGIFEIDSYASKMGDDANIVTLSFSVITKEAADDLVNFLEKGYSFVLDADATAGEQSDGTYKVFVELERNKNVPEQIFEITDGISKLTNHDELKFRYYKSFRSVPSNLDSIKEAVPIDPDSYGIKKDQFGMDNYKQFFNNSYLESIDMYNDTLKLKKAYADPLMLEFVDFGDTKTIKNNIKGTFNLNESYPEILFLTKYVGDYNISKYGENLVFENEDKALVLKRI